MPIAGNPLKVGGVIKENDQCAPNGHFDGNVIISILIEIAPTILDPREIQETKMSHLDTCICSTISMS
jgi:hypothetical protein